MTVCPVYSLSLLVYCLNFVEFIVCLVYSKIARPGDSHQLQQDIDTVCTWSKNWLLELKTDKYNVLHVSWKKSPIKYDYCLNNHISTNTNDHKHLRIWLHRHMVWDCHVNNICAKANHVLGLIRRSFGIKDKGN